MRIRPEPFRLGFFLCRRPCGLRFSDIAGERSLSISAAGGEAPGKQLDAAERSEASMQYGRPDDSGSVLVVGGAAMRADWSQAQGERASSIEAGGGRGLRVHGAMNSYLPAATDCCPAGRFLLARIFKLPSCHRLLSGIEYQLAADEAATSEWWNGRHASLRC